MKIVSAFFIFFLVIIAGLVTGRILYKKALRRQEWYETSGLTLVSDDCPHPVEVPYGQASSLTWKRREIRVRAGVFGKQRLYKKVRYRIRCETCGRKHSYRIVETPETLRFNRLGVIYTLGTLICTMLIFGLVIAPVLNYLFGF
ncbi:hypothetical protein ACFFIY_12900 [Bhargavaea ullalensis]|uniref:Ribosomal protein L44E n=1 Tax=Bhargavaea ullalensis TaxID=1265685 RepID=A0ABV2G7W1_9BACL